VRRRTGRHDSDRPEEAVMKVLGIDNAFVQVGDLARAVEFYRDVVGLPVAKRFDERGMVLSRATSSATARRCVALPSGPTGRAFQDAQNITGAR
jgi:catechol 2,3-dioxygenase-like lactoylglutathione lyase family enzyme